MTSDYECRALKLQHAAASEGYQCKGIMRRHRKTLLRCDMCGRVVRAERAPSPA